MKYLVKQISNVTESEEYKSQINNLPIAYEPHEICTPQN